MRTSTYGFGALFVPMMMGALLVQGCGEDSALPGGAGDLAAQCGLVCSAEGIVEGNASISGLQSIDAFFNAVVNFNAKANIVASNIDLQLGRIRGALGVETNAEIRAALEAKISANVEGGFKIVAEPAKCEITASATVEAAAKCDAEVDPGMVSAKCEGSCTAEASAMAECSGEATLKCSGTAPSLACEGTCKAECTGTCTMDGTAKCQGTCMGSTDDGGNCDGECQLSAGATCNGSCEGECKGECEYTPPSGECEAGAQVKCEASASASVECEGKCEGEVEPPMVKAECQASAKAEAELNAECTPPKLDVQFEFAAGIDASAQAEFEAFLSVFVDAYGEILAEVGRADIVVEAGADLVGAAEGAVTGAVEELSVNGDLKAIVGAGCALDQLPLVVGVIGDATAKLEGSVSATADITEVVSGG